jgi:hypothetical protein
MMKAITASFLISAVFVISLTWSVFASDAQKACKDEISQVDSDFSTVTVKRVNDPVAETYDLIQYSVNEDTKIIKDDHEVDKSQLFPGDRVCIETKFDPDQGVEVAVLIRVVHDY